MFSGCSKSSLPGVLNYIFQNFKKIIEMDRYEERITAYLRVPFCVLGGIDSQQNAACNTEKTATSV